MKITTRWVYLCSFIGVVGGLYPAMGEEGTSLLPLWRSSAGNEKLPLPYGIGVDYYYQRQGYDVVGVPSISLPPQSLAGLPPSVVAGLQNPNAFSTLDVKTRVNEGDGKVDAWLFPFLNVFALGGYVAEHTTVTGIPVLNELSVNENGYIFGGGMTLAGSIQRVWGSLLVAETYANLSDNDSWIRSWVVSPKVGVQLDAPWGEKSWNVWVGGMFQRTDESHSGTLGTAVGPVTYNMKLQEEQAWNALLGASVNLYKHWDAAVEFGIGQRDSAMASLVYRF